MSDANPAHPGGPKMRSVSLGDMTGLLISALKALDRRVDEIAAREARIRTLEQRLAALERELRARRRAGRP